MKNGILVSYVKGKIEGSVRQGRRRKQLLDDLNKVGSSISVAELVA
jgi:hypothetical protein